MILVDGGSADDTIAVARRAGARVVSSPRGRARQLNAGAALAKADIVLFLHADSRLPQEWQHDVEGALEGPSGREWGCFESIAIDVRPRGVPDSSANNAVFFLKQATVRILSERYKLYKLSFVIILQGSPWTSWLVRQSVAARTRLLNRPYGDQALFMRRATFHRAGGFPSDWPLLEDVDLVQRLNRACGPPSIVPFSVQTSGRRWQALGLLRTTLINQTILAGHALGVNVRTLAKLYETSGGRNTAENTVT